MPKAPSSTADALAPGRRPGALRVLRVTRNNHPRRGGMARSGERYPAVLRRKASGAPARGAVALAGEP